MGKLTRIVVAGERPGAAVEFVGMLLGSVSQHVATHAHCPVLIERDDDPPAG